jgi:hypothetical protein
MRDAVSVKMRQMKSPGARSAKHKRKKAEAETDCETD